MGNSPALDLGLLRTLALIAEEGRFTRAAERVGRTQSAVSQQVQRLEALVGQALILRGKGGSVELTAHGRTLMERGRELLALNDEIVQSLHVEKVHRSVRLGADGGYSRPWIPSILTRFARTHPEITVEISRDGSCELVPRLKAGELDLILCEGGFEPRQWPAKELWRGRLEWVTSDAHRRHLDDPLPLVLTPGNCPFRPPWLADCIWRYSAIRALERAGRRYKIVSTFPTVWGLQDAVIAGLAVTVLPTTGVPEGLRPTRPDEGLPELPEVSLLLLKAYAPRQPLTDALAAHIVEAFSGMLHCAPWPRRDVIETPLEGDLDVSGCEFGKAVNAVIISSTLPWSIGARGEPQ
jgi:DNA-binding transcriptional LysR family regulator